MKRYISLFLALMMCCCLFAGCSPKDDGSGAPPSVDADGLKVQEIVSGTINPLTGEQVDKDTSDMRPYCVMINNHPDARPCAGLSQAAMVYEVVVEGGITRLMAVFNDIDGITLGSIRSCRPYYLSLAQSYDAIYVHAGGSEQGYSDIKSLGINNIDGVRGYRDGEASSYYRDSNRKSLGVAIEHTLFADGAKLASFAKNNYTMTHASSFDTTYGLVFSPDAASQCEKSSTSALINFSGWYSSVLKYDSSKSCYNLFMSDKEYIDDVETGRSDDNTSIDFTNVIILDVPTKTIDSYGRQEMEVTGSGSGYFCCGGKYIEIKWERADRSDNFHYYLTDGTPLALGIGKTYVAIADFAQYGGVVFSA
ncbi:MAG: DUF3048 domain-containing protein [Bacillota bacterium]|nr:DUF3048 domain-containing protein [Bacillota bacterium]